MRRPSSAAPRQSPRHSHCGCQVLISFPSCPCPCQYQIQVQSREGLYSSLQTSQTWSWPCGVQSWVASPVSKSNEYGARAGKNIKTGNLTDKSYIPSGLTKAQYEKIRGDADTKKAANYQMNVAKAGKFLDYTDFYLARGTSEDYAWRKQPNSGHRMAKTKFDWSGEKNDNPEYTGLGKGIGSIFGKKK